MTRGRFNVTFETITPESAEQGDFADSGYMASDVPLREALSAIGRWYTRSRGAGLEDAGRWFNTIDDEIDYRTGEHTRYAIHPPKGITPASYRRVARVLTGWGR